MGRIQMWNGAYKQACAVTTFKSIIGNCIIGVTEGFRYRMKMVHAHFPITAIISKDKKQVEIKNFLGGKKSHLIKMQPGCTVMLNPSKDVKNELIFEGTDNAAVSLGCSQVAVSAKSRRRMKENSWTVSSFPLRSSSTQKNDYSKGQCDELNVNYQSLMKRVLMVYIYRCF